MRKSKRTWGKSGKRVICKANGGDVGVKRKRKTGAFQQANNQGNWSRDEGDMDETKMKISENSEN